MDFFKMSQEDGNYFKIAQLFNGLDNRRQLGVGAVRANPRHSEVRIETVRRLMGLVYENVLTKLKKHILNQATIS